MNASKLPALRTLVRIRLKRQDVLDGLKSHAQDELKQRMKMVDAAATALSQGNDRLDLQTTKLETLTTAGARFQVSQYLAEQDFLSTLSTESLQLEAKLTDTHAAVASQHIVLKKSRTAASHNETRREQLEAEIVSILARIDIAQMDRQDEEAEEANIVLTRCRQREVDTLAGISDHA